MLTPIYKPTMQSSMQALLSSAWSIISACSCVPAYAVEDDTCCSAAQEINIKTFIN